MPVIPVILPLSFAHPVSANYDLAIEQASWYWRIIYSNTTTEFVSSLLPVNLHQRLRWNPKAMPTRKEERLLVENQMQKKKLNHYMVENTSRVKTCSNSTFSSTISFGYLTNQKPGPAATARASRRNKAFVNTWPLAIFFNHYLLFLNEEWSYTIRSRIYGSAS